jgi:hypothetical protein
MLTAIAGANWQASAGDEISLAPSEAKRFIKAGLAVETQMKAPAENAALKTRRPQGRKAPKKPKSTQQGD